MLRSIVFSLACVLIPLEGEAQLTREQFDRLMETTRWLSSHQIEYRESIHLPDEEGEWMMDCSNTVRYLYRRALGVDLPRVASGQYWVLDQRGLVFPAPYREDGTVDTPELLGGLASGDLLFWEWTYDIKRRPPITHVMIYLGRRADGTPMMVGSSSRTNGGVGIYRFDPNAPMGGVRNFFGGWKHKARFVGYGRPLQAGQDVLELAQATSKR